MRPQLLVPSACRSSWRYARCSCPQTRTPTFGAPSETSRCACMHACKRRSVAELSLWGVRRALVLPEASVQTSQCAAYKAALCQGCEWGTCIATTTLCLHPSALRACLRTGRQTAATVRKDVVIRAGLRCSRIAHCRAPRDVELPLQQRQLPYVRRGDDRRGVPVRECDHGRSKALRCACCGRLNTGACRGQALQHVLHHRRRWHHSRKA